VKFVVIGGTGPNGSKIVAILRQGGCDSKQLSALSLEGRGRPKI
jgi:hypothetical protein